MNNKPPLIITGGPIIDQVPDEFPESGGPCEDCAHSVWDPTGKEPLGSCRIGRPHTQIALFPPRVAGGGPISVPMGGWPPVKRREGCGEFAAKKAKQQ